MSKIQYPIEYFDPVCPKCGGELDIDDGNGLFECECGWTEKRDGFTVCPKCSGDTNQREVNKHDGFCRKCAAELRRFLHGQ